MLHDRMETMLAQDTHLLDEDVTAKAYHLMEERNGQGKSCRPLSPHPLSSQD